MAQRHRNTQMNGVINDLVGDITPLQSFGAGLLLGFIIVGL